MVQNTAARLPPGKDYQKHPDRFTLLLKEIHWLLIYFQICFSVLVLAFKALNVWGWENGPPVPCTLCQLIISLPDVLLWMAQSSEVKCMRQDVINQVVFLVVYLLYMLRWNCLLSSSDICASRFSLTG